MASLWHTGEQGTLGKRRELWKMYGSQMVCGGGVGGDFMEEMCSNKVKGGEEKIR